jgi:hypothetical protein
MDFAFGAKFVNRSQAYLKCISYNAGFVKYFFPTLFHPLRDERHFALVEISAIDRPTQFSMSEIAVSNTDPATTLHSV